MDSHRDSNGMLTLALSLSLLGAEPDLQGGVIERIEAKLDQHREALDRSATESKAWRGIFERVETWDGHRVAGFFQAVFAPLKALVVGIYNIIYLALIALIAVCIARSIRDFSEAIRVWMPARK
jgi:hypothetical protein